MQMPKTKTKKENKLKTIKSIKKKIDYGRQK